MFPFIGAIGFGIGVLSDLMKSGQEQEELRQQAAELERQRRMALQEAAHVRIAGADAAMIKKMEGTRLLSQASIAAARGGVEESGSALAGMRLSALMNSVDVQSIANSAYRKAWGLDQEADSLQRQANMVKQRAKNAQIGSALGIAGKAIGFGAQMYSGLQGIGGTPTATAPTTASGSASVSASAIAEWEKKWGYEWGDRDVKGSPIRVRVGT